MNVFRTPQDMRMWSLQQKCAGKSVGFVPTMGDLHNGHLSLMREAVARDDVAVLSIYVNPTQFAPNEDFDTYPRNFESDAKLAREAGIEAIYAPLNLYPQGYATYVDVERLTQGLCSNTRPHFFRGVTTVVTKLFTAVLPDRAYFGQKDAQQCAIIKRMATDLDLGVEVIEMPIIRETDGLAMSSRHRYLSEAHRQEALCLSRSLFEAQRRLAAGERSVERIKALVRAGMHYIDVDYVELVDAETMRPVENVDGTILLAVAAKVGPARLIDNIKFTVPEAVYAEKEEEVVCI